MKNKFDWCDKCEEDTIHSVRKVFSSRRRKLRRTVDKCHKCQKIIIKNAKTGTRVR